jgi:hypothetical protein
VLVAWACNPSYLGDRDQEDCSLKPGQANSSRDPISTKPITKKKADGVAQGIGPVFKPQYHKTKQEKIVSFSMCLLSGEKMLVDHNLQYCHIKT